MGDFNINYNDSKSQKDFKNVMKLNGFEQLVTSATRITKESSTLIDLIFSNRTSSLPSVSVVSTSLSDHDLVACTRKINTQKYLPRTIKCRNYAKYDTKLLADDVRNIDWQPIYDNNSDVNTAVIYLSKQLLQIFNTHAPVVEKPVKGKSCEWLDETIKKEMNTRDQLLRRARRRNDETSWREYKQQRNKCTNKVKKAKATYHHRLLNNDPQNSRKFWNTIKSIFPTKPKNTIPNFVDNTERANKFGSYFSNIVRKLKSCAYPLTNFTWKYPRKRSLRTDKIFRFSYISTAFVEREIRQLKQNKATGTDQLPPNLLKDCSVLIAKPIAHILNLSVKTSTVPSLWKSAKICPIFKSGKSELVENYRPISVLPVLSKILEKTVHQQLYSFLETNSLLNDCQFGYRKRRSTKLATALFCDKIRREIENGLLVGCVYLDLSKAFDTIGHSVLLEKLILYGVCGPELAWFTDYLFNRTQLVEINNAVSDESAIMSGVPQGSILGPLLFIVFFDDFKDNLVNCDVTQYADDTVIMFAHKDVEIVEKVLNSDMNHISRYCTENELLLNLKKGENGSDANGNSSTSSPTRTRTEYIIQRPTY